MRLVLRYIPFLCPKFLRTALALTLTAHSSQPSPLTHPNPYCSLTLTLPSHLYRAPSMAAGRYEVLVAGQVTAHPLHLTYTDALAPRADASLSGLTGAAGDTLWIQVGQ